MTCEVEKLSGVIRIRGEMTIYDAAVIKDALFGALQGESDVCLDLSGVSEVDTTGLQLLLMAHRACATHAVPFTVTQLSDVMRETLALLRLNVLIPTIQPEVAP